MRRGQWCGEREAGGCVALSATREGPICHLVPMVDAEANLHPLRATPLEDTRVTKFSSGAVIAVSTDGQACTVR